MPYALLRDTSLLEATWAAIRHAFTHSILYRRTARPLGREVDEHISHRHLQDVLVGKRWPMPSWICQLVRT